LLKVIQDGFGARDTMEIVRRMITNVENAFDDKRSERRRRSVTGTRVADKHIVIVWSSLA